MSSHGSPQWPCSPSSDTRPLADVRSLQRCLSNLSQASTLVGSESGDDPDAGTSSTPQVTIQHHPTEQSRAPEHYVQHHAAVSADSTDTILQDFDEIRKMAQDCVRAMHVLFDPSMNFINRINTNMGVAERLTEGGDRLMAYILFQRVLREIERGWPAV
jgi:hypothetical protein